MPQFELILIAAIAVLLLIAVFGAKRSPGLDEAPYSDEPHVPDSSSVGHAVDPPAPSPIARAPQFTGEFHIVAPTAGPFRLPPPPANAVDIGQMEIGQTLVLRTDAAKYVLTLRDPKVRSFDAVRVGQNPEGTASTESFRMIFHGTFLPDAGVYRNCFVPGGHLLYQKIVGDVVHRVSPSTRIGAVLFECRPLERMRMPSEVA